jgi:catechol 2,3-dioxygenase-like lactoylglutathione lyase family enzyme
MERSKNFYRTVLGVDVAVDFGANVILTCGVFLQTLETWREFIGKDETAFYNHVMELCFETDDFDKFVEKLCDVTFVHPPLEHPWGQRVVRFYDPGGHIVEVGENMAGYSAFYGWRYDNCPNCCAYGCSRRIHTVNAVCK